MSYAALEAAIESAWEARDSITPATKGEARDAIEATLSFARQANNELELASQALNGQYLAQEVKTSMDIYPVRPEFVGTVKIAGLISKANIKITDIEGNLVYETTSEGGTVEWDTTAFGKYKVASGVYMIFIAAEDASETTVKKVMIIR